MTHADLDEDDPIYKAIDKGGGQTCDVAGVIRELMAAGFLIVSKDEFERLQEREHEAEQLGMDRNLAD